MTMLVVGIMRSDFWKLLLLYMVLHTAAAHILADAMYCACLVVSCLPNVLAGVPHGRFKAFLVGAILLAVQIREPKTDIKGSAVAASNSPATSAWLGPYAWITVNEAPTTIETVCYEKSQAEYGQDIASMDISKLTTTQAAGSELGMWITNTQKYSFPAIVSIGAPNQGHTCLGTLFHKEYVLTAAHCLQGVIQENTVVTFGWSRGEAKEIRANRVHVHPKWDGNFYTAPHLDDPILDIGSKGFAFRTNGSFKTAQCHTVEGSSCIARLGLGDMLCVYSPKAEVLAGLSGGPVAVFGFSAAPNVTERQHNLDLVVDILCAYDTDGPKNSISLISMSSLRGWIDEVVQDAPGTLYTDRTTRIRVGGRNISISSIPLRSSRERISFHILPLQMWTVLLLIFVSCSGVICRWRTCGTALTESQMDNILRFFKCISFGLSQLEHNTSSGSYDPVNMLNRADYVRDDLEARRFNVDGERKSTSVSLGRLLSDLDATLDLRYSDLLIIFIDTAKDLKRIHSLESKHIDIRPGNIFVILDNVLESGVQSDKVSSLGEGVGCSEMVRAHHSKIDWLRIFWRYICTGRARRAERCQSNGRCHGAARQKALHGGTLSVLKARLVDGREVKLHDNGFEPTFEPDPYGYIAPECFSCAEIAQRRTGRAENDELQEARDVYAIGVLMWDCLTGCPERNFQEVIFRKSLRTMSHVYSEKIMRLITQCTSELPADRPGISAVVAALESIQRDSGEDKLCQGVKRRLSDLNSVKCNTRACGRCAFLSYRDGLRIFLGICEELARKAEQCPRVLCRFELSAQNLVVQRRQIDRGYEAILVQNRSSQDWFPETGNMGTMPPDHGENILDLVGCVDGPIASVKANLPALRALMRDWFLCSCVAAVDSCMMRIRSSIAQLIDECCEGKAVYTYRDAAKKIEEVLDRPEVWLQRPGGVPCQCRSSVAVAVSQLVGDDAVQVKRHCRAKAKTSEAATGWKGADAPSWWD